MTGLDCNVFRSARSIYSAIYRRSLFDMQSV